MASAVTPFAVAPPFGRSAKHSCARAVCIASRPIDVSHLSENLRSVRSPLRLYGIAPVGSAPSVDAEDVAPEPDDVAVVFLSSPPARTTTTAMIAITTTIATIGPYRRKLLPRSGEELALLGCMIPPN